MVTYTIFKNNSSHYLHSTTIYPLQTTPKIPIHEITCPNRSLMPPRRSFINKSSELSRKKSSNFIDLCSTIQSLQRSIAIVNSRLFYVFAFFSFLIFSFHFILDRMRDDDCGAICYYYSCVCCCCC